MNLENDIPDYAMVPAKRLEEKKLEPITNNAIYMPIEVTNVLEGQKLTFVIEEDVLVPDIKPDLKEILIMEGTSHLSTREIQAHTSDADYINLSGELIVQTLYCPERPNPLCPVVSIETKIPFKEQCKLNKADTILLNCHVEKIEHIIINERKYRVKATIVVSTREYNNCSYNLFDGIKGEDLHVLKHKTEFSTVAMRKKDILSIKEYVSPINDTLPGQLLFKDIHITENYKQLTNDKLIINGFICLNILYCDKSPIGDVSPSQNIHQVQERLEFTQFVPLHNISGVSCCNLDFDTRELKLKICQHEDGQEIFQLEGDLITYVELYKKIEKDIIVDGYHRDKDFVFQKKEDSINVLVGSSTSDSSVREIFVPKDLPSDIDCLLFTTGKILKNEHRYEQGKVVTEGIILAKIVCGLSGENFETVTVTEEVPYRIISPIANLTGDEVFHQEVCLKDFWSEKINGKQLEFNASILAKTEAVKTSAFIQLTNPAFETGYPKDNPSPIIIYCCTKEDSLWHIAKKFRTSKEIIAEINNLERDEITEGQKLLIMR